MLVLTGILLFSLYSGSALAIETNPGSNLTCPANSTKGFLSNDSYSSLVTSFTNNSYQTVVSQTTSTGNTNANIPLKVKMSVISSGESAGNTPATYGSSPQAISFVGSPSSQSPSTAITLDFQSTESNSANNKPVFLTNVAMSAFDIDKSVNSGSWDDNVKITGITQSGAPITGKFQNIPNSRVIGSSSGLRLPSTPDNDNCTSALQSDCQGSIVFDEPVKSVTLVYTDLKSNRNITSRRFEFRLDSYCYVPSNYEITKSDGVNSVDTNSITDYIIKVTNLGNTTITNITLKDPIVNGLNKLTGITCDASDANNVCTTAPTKEQLESSSGFNISSLAVGKSFSIKVPTRVTATSNSNITNTATISHQTIATKSASDTNSITFSNNLGGTSVPATCPANHKMYYLGSSRTATSLVRPQALSWTNNGSTSQTFNFNNSNNNEPSGNKTFKIEFPLLLDINSTGSTPPYYGSVNGVSVDAINLQHNSVGVKTNHTLDISVNRPVSKIGYKIQDIDSTSNNSNQVPYVEEIDVSNSRGQLTFNEIFHTINANKDAVSAIKGLNCGVNNGANDCTIDATWDYTPANIPLRLEHKNIFTQYDSYHAVGYSDFYFCLAPPKVVVKKVLIGNRVNDTEAQRDQFNIKVSGGILTPDATNSPASFTTTGDGSTISNATSSVLTLQTANSYTITERVLTGTNEGNINNYKASYECTNATTDSTTTMPKGSGNSFSLSNLDYGDEITCTITNAPSAYTFTGFVFNDNGGIIENTSSDPDVNTKSDISSTFAGNAKYFNGLFDTGEVGISATGLTVSLTNCNSAVIAGTTPQTVSNNPLGQYKFTVPANTIANLPNQKVCLVQNEPSGWDFSVDTTPNTREVKLVANTFDYKTESNGLRNLDFGEVKANYAALVLKKSQYLYDCTIVNFDNINAQATPTNSPREGFTTNPATDAIPGECIAYKIEAFNRGHVDLKEVQISDTLQTASVKSTFYTQQPNYGVPQGVYTYRSSNPNDVKIESNKFDLNAVPSSSTTASKGTLFFSTKYGTTSGNP